MKFRRILLIWVAALGVAWLMAACATDKTVAPESFTGTLQRVMAIGGETTGWQLTRDQGGVFEVKVEPGTDGAALAEDGARVTIAGELVPHRYVERGEVLQLVAKKISPAPRP